MLLDILHAKLKRSREPGLEGRLQAIREGTPDVRRTNQIESAGRAFLGSERLREFLSYLVQRQAGTFSVDAS